MLHSLAELIMAWAETAQQSDLFSPLRLFDYITFRAGGAALTAFALSLCFGGRLIRQLLVWRFGQGYVDVAGRSTGKDVSVRELKKGTPTMGGLLILTTVSVSILLWTKWSGLVIWSLTPFLVMGAVGAIDDWTKLRRKDGLGISGRIKVLAQTALALGLTLFLYLDESSRSLAVDIVVPFRQQPVLEGVLILGAVLIWLTMTGSSNAVNITDGLDGLAAGCVMITAFCFLVITYAAGNAIWADYLLIRHVPGAGELSVICAALIGGCLGFLWFNAYPAKMFMGDTGSLALGGILGSIAIMVHQPFVLLIAGGVFVMEALSVVIQRYVFKFTRIRYGQGRRVFRMAPIHHHFEQLHWSEPTIVTRFYILSVVFAIVALGTFKIR